MATHYYNQSFRTYIQYFGSLFDGITIKRGNDSEVKVGIEYSGKEPLVQRLQRDPMLKNQVSVRLPRIGFNITSVAYDVTRKVNRAHTLMYIDNPLDPTSVKKTYSPIPYNIDLDFGIYTQNAEDGYQILEQILPLFQPEFTKSLRLIPGIDEIFDIPIILTTVSSEETFETDARTRVAHILSLGFTMRAYVFPRVSDGAKVITQAQTNITLLNQDLSKLTANTTATRIETSGNTSNVITWSDIPGF